jgi:U3 small nucleolar RNA-associated protein 10
LHIEAIMATALQQQLAAISAKSTDQLNLKAQKQRHAKSLLFEPREAASQSFDTLFQICGEGFDDLCTLDARFRSFATNLFAPSSVEVERETLNKKENDDLNTVVEQFLGLICGRLLLKPALKCVEWLIRRWKALEHNVATLLLAFLPYHGHDVFPTLMSILPAQLPTSFGFLRPYVAALQSPPRHAVVAAAVSNPTFTVQLSTFVLNSAKRRHHSSALIGFWASVTAQAVNGMLDAAQSGRPAVRKQKIEDVLYRILPVLQEALSLKDVAELYMASCMIMTILATKAHLDDRVLDAMMEAVAGAWTNETLEDGLLCLSVLAEEKNLLEQPSSVTKSIMGNDEAVATLDRLGERHRTGKLVLETILAVTKSKQQIENPALLWTLSENASLDYQHYETLSRELLTGLNDSSATQLAKNKQRALLQHLSATPEISQYVQAAAEKTGHNMKQLGLNLVEPPQPDAMVVDEPSVPEIKSASTVDFAQVLRDLSKLTTSGDSNSFVAPALSKEKLHKLIDAFQIAGQEQDNFSQLLQSPTLRQQDAETKPEFFTALAATWTASKSAAARSRALTSASEQISKSKSLDYQGLVPYTLIALGDANKTVRQAAAKFILALSSTYTSPAGMKIWCKDTIYGKQSGSINHLGAQDVSKFLSEIVSPVLEDCILDPTFLARNVAEQLNDSDMKSALRSSICSFIASHAVVTAIPEVKLGLLALTARFGKVASHARKESIVPYAKNQIKQTANDSSIEQAVIRCLSYRTSDEIDTVQEIAEQGKGSFASMAFKRLRELFSHMKPQSQTSIADFLLEQSVIPDNESTGNEVSRSASAHESLREAPLTGDVLAHLLDTLPTPATLQDQERPSKRRRTSKSNTDELKSVDRAQLDIALRKLTLVLELVEGVTSSKRAEPMPQILKGLFHLLGEVHHWRLLADSDLVYVQSLLLGDLLSVVNGLEVSAAKQLDRSVLRTDLIVEALRSTSSPQVHNTALLLISRLATLAPESVLHSVMPLFTFMSTNTLRQADQYASHVVNMTVESIVPPLAASLKKGGRDLIQGASELLLSFTAAWEHMPLHRRLATFKHLVQTLGEGEALFAVVAMLVERYRQDNTLPAFVKELCNACQIDTQLSAVKQYLNLIQEACKPRRPVADAILGFGEKNPEQVKESIVVLFDGLPIILANPGLRKGIATEMQKSDEAAEEVRKVYGDVLERIVSFSNVQTGKGGVNVQDPRIAAANERALEALLGLMPTEEFIEASAGLMQTGSEAVRTRVFTSLTERVGSAKQSNMALRTVFIDALPNCTAFLVASQPISVRRAAVDCVDGIAEKYGKLDRAACADAAEVVASDAALGTAEGGLRVTSLLCLASMVESLADDMLGLTPVVLDQALRFLESSDASEVSEMRDAVFKFLNALLDTLPFTLSATYLDRAIVAAAKSVQTDGERVWDVQQFSNLAAKKIAFPELTTAMSRVWENIAQTGAEGVLLCVETLQQAIKTQTKATVTRHAATLFPAMLKAFDLRRVLSEDEGTDAFRLVGETAMDMTLKLNDTTFRPFFLRLVSWAAEELPKSDNVGRTLRGVALYDFAHRLFEQLGGLVTSYSGVVLENVVTVLDTAESASQEGRELLAHALRAMQSSFSNDQDDFWSAPQHFDAIRTPLVNLLASATTLSANSIIPAITAFADAVSASQDNLKTLNTSIMALLKHEDDAVRLAAVQCERAVTQHLAFDWLNLLPEMLPVISELLEDDNEEVERECLAWVREIEGVTGESLEGMLS